MLISKVSKAYTGFLVGWSLFTEVCMCNIQKGKKKAPSYFKTENNCTAIQWLCLYKHKKIYVIFYLSYLNSFYW